MDIKPIAIFHCPLPEKFGLPRQAGLAASLRGTVVLEPDFRAPEALRGLDGFDYLWLIWGFHLNKETASEGLTVRPPRLGGNERVGVFASRSPYRPNPLGLSSVRIERVDAAAGKIYFRWVPATSITDEWITTQSLKIVPEGRGNSVNVYGTLVYGQDAFGCVELGGNGANVEVILKPTGSSGALDPLNQRGSVGWKVKGFCTVILQDDFIVRIESGATA